MADTVGDKRGEAELEMGLCHRPSLYRQNTHAPSLIWRTPGALAALLPPALFPFLSERILNREI